MIKLYRLVQLHEQVIVEQRRADEHSDDTTVHTFRVIEGALCNIKADAAKVYTGIAITFYTKRCVSSHFML